MTRNLFKIWRKIWNLRESHRAHTAAISMAAVVIIWIAWILLIPTLSLMSSREITIIQGQGLYSIADTLKVAGYIRSRNIFTLYVYVRGWEHELKAGDYVLPAHANIPDIARELAHGFAQSNDVEVVIPEGTNIWEVDRKLTAAGFSTGTAFAKQYYTKEGGLFPDTYRFNPKSSLAEIAARMEQNFKVKTESLDDISRETIIIASMLEKEARTENDMRLVAGVIRNRLKKGMKLEIDATIAYGACLRQYIAAPTKDCQVNLVPVGTEIKIDSAFNTYIRKGLPPSPISNPGLAAVEAALHPVGDYLYYLSPRGGGDLIFSHTAVEHAANRRKYLGL